jgi:excisionase family DNA binding protein
MENINNINTEYERWLNMEEISQYLGVSKDTVRGWIKKGAIPGHKVGRQYKFKVSEVDGWITSGKSANADK